MAKYLIKTPNPHFTGERFGLMFQNGKAETDDDVLARKMKHELGYTVEKQKASNKTDAKGAKASNKSDAKGSENNTHQKQQG